MALRHAANRRAIPGNRRADALKAPVEFRVEVAHERHQVRVRAVGELDLATVQRLRERIDAALESGAELVILDLRETTFIDATGLRLTVEADARAAAHGIGFAIIAGPPAVRRTFELAGLSARLPFVAVPRG